MLCCLGRAIATYYKQKRMVYESNHVISKDETLLEALMKINSLMSSLY